MSGEERSVENGARFPAMLRGDRWELSWDAGGTEIVGGSVAALATAFAVPRYSVAVDMGRCSAALAAQGTVLLSHCHSDHVAGLLAWLSAHTRRYREGTTRVYLPVDRREALLEVLRIWPDLDGVRRRVDLDDVLAGVAPGEAVPLAGGGEARAFAVRHTVPSLGWAVGLAGARPDAVFAGDGTVEPFRENPELLDAGLALVDCTLVEPGTRVAARLAGHGHLKDWLELAPSLGCDTLALAHLPPGLEAQRVVELIASEPPARGPQLAVWMADDGIGNGGNNDAG